MDQTQQETSLRDHSPPSMDFKSTNISLADLSQELRDHSPPTMDSRSTNISLAVLPMELRDQIYHDVFAETPSRSTIPRIQASLTSTNKTGISLLLLPTEIRHQIYRHVFHTRYIIPSFTDLTFPEQASSYAGNRISNTSLLQTCKDLHHDALEFMYATVTFRVLFPQGTQETLIGPRQSVIDRMRHVEIDIDMTHYDLPRASQRTEEHFTKPKLIDIFYATILDKLSVRETTGVACRVILHSCFRSQSPWNTLPFFEALRRVPNFTTVTVELRSHSATFSPRIGSADAWGLDFRFKCLETELNSRLQKTMKLSRGQDSGNYRSLEFHRQDVVVKETVTDIASATEDADEDEAGNEGAGEEGTSEDGPEDEDSGEEDLNEMYSDDEDCFQDWKWRSL